VDEIVASDTGEALSERLWRRYASNAGKMLDAIERDATLAEPLIAGTGIRRCEIEYLAQQEMIVKLEDFLRRRSKLELLMPKAELRNSEGLREACDILFGDNAQRRIDEYFN
jgi:glycerol-3-phosphate dehydrogenase